MEYILSSSPLRPHEPPAAGKKLDVGYKTFYLLSFQFVCELPTIQHGHLFELSLENNKEQPTKQDTTCVSQFKFIHKKGNDSLTQTAPWIQISLLHRYINQHHYILYSTCNSPLISIDKKLSHLYIYPSPRDRQKTRMTSSA